MDDKETQAKAEFIIGLLKPEAKFEGMQEALVPRIKAKYEEMEAFNKRLAEMIQEATQLKADLDADRATIAELEGILWDEFQRNTKPKQAKQAKKKSGGVR